MYESTKNAMFIELQFLEYVTLCLINFWSIFNFNNYKYYLNQIGMLLM